MAGLDLSGSLALDTNCLSYLLFDGEPVRQQKMMRALDAARGFGVQFAALAAAEVMVEPVRKGDSERLGNVESILKSDSDLQCIVMTMDVARVAAQIRGTSSLKLPDAVVIASAIIGQASLLLSNDRRVVRVASDYLRAVYFDDWEP